MAVMFPAVGSRVGRYEIVGPLGAGGMGAVYRAHDTQLDRLVAIKILTSSGGTAPAQQARFEREARAIARLNHPHICTLYDVGQQDGRAFMVMELLEGNTLAGELAHGPLPVDRAVAFGVEIAEALDAAHSRGVIHLDLKPSNVMVTGNGVKLLDFGVAQLRELDQPTDSQDSTFRIGPPESGTILGSYPYMSPEQLQGSRTDARSDIFALGVVLYEMATGGRPFQADNRAALTAAILTFAPPPVSSVCAAPPLLDRVVARCLEKDPDARWQTARDLASALRWASENEFSVAVPATNATGVKRRRRLQRWGPALAVVVGLPILAAVALGVPSNLAMFRPVVPSFDRLRGACGGVRCGPRPARHGRRVPLHVGPIGPESGWQHSSTR